MTWLYLPSQALTPAAQRACSAYRFAPVPAASTSDLSWPSPDTVLWVTSSGTPLPLEKRMAGNHTVNLADQPLGWPTPRASDGNKPSAGKRWDADPDHRARLWPTPNVPNGGRVNPPGTSTTGQEQETDRSGRGRAMQRATLDDAECVGLEIGRGEPTLQRALERQGLLSGQETAV